MTKGLLLTFSILLGVGLAGLGLVSTETGLHIIWRVAVPLVHSLADIDMRADKISGSLLGPVEVSGFHYLDPTVEVEIDEGNIRWQFSQLLAARVQIDNVKATRVRVTLQERESSGSEDTVPALIPLTVHIENTKVDEVQFQLSPDSDVWNFKEAVGRVRVLQDRVVIEHLTTGAYGIHGEANGFISWHDAFPLALNATLTQSISDDSVLTSNIEAAGDLEEFKLHLRTDAPHNSDLAMHWKSVAAGYAITLQGPFEPAPLLIALGQLPAEALSTGPIKTDASGILSAAGFDISRLQLLHDISRLDASGRLDWSSEVLSWSAQADWLKLALPPWAPALFSESGKARVTGSMEQGLIEIDAAYAVEGQKPGQAVLAAEWQSERIHLKQGALHAGKSKLEGKGLIWPRADLNWAIYSDNLGELWPAAGGHIKGTGRLSGDWRAPRIKGQLQGGSIQIASLQLDKLGIDADLDLDKDSQGHLQVIAQGLQLPDLEPTSLKLDASGKRSDHRLLLSLNNPQLSGEAEAKGSWAGGKTPWQGNLLTMTLKPQNTGNWQLSTPADIYLHPDRIKVGEVCLNEEQSLLCARGSMQAGQWQGAAQLTKLPLNMLSPWLPVSFLLNGHANAQAKATGFADQWQTINITADARGRLSRPGVEDELDIQLHGLSLIANPEVWNSELELQVNGNGHISADASAEPQAGEWQTAKLRGNLRLDLPQLEELTLIAPEIEKLRGKIKGDIQASGTLGQPIFGGRLALEDGHLDLRDYGISLSPLTATVTGQSDGRLDLQMQATSGGGTLQAKGQARTNLQETSLSMNIKGERFLASRTDEATLYISPDLDLKIQDKNVELGGELRIPEAHLKPGQQQATAQAISTDQILITDDQTKPRDPLWNLIAKLRLILGDKVFFKGVGVETRLEGQLDIRENPGKRTVANGEIRLIDGAYEVYGQKLDIDSGRLIFANAPVTEPALDIKASRIPRVDIKVGVRVRGMLDAPVVTLFSTPSMRQAEQLSYLVLGRPLEGNEGNPSLAGAALAMGLKRGDNFIRGLGDTFNVDEIGIETTPGESSAQASLVVGKYLSPRLYVSYGAGLFEPLHKLRMRYRMTEHWTLVGESGTAQGADILYTIER